MFRLDWRASSDDIKFAVNSLLLRKGLSNLESLWEQVEKGIPSYSALNIIASGLETIGLKLMFIDDGSDSFPLVLVKKDDCEELKDVAEEIGIEIIDHFA